MMQSELLKETKIEDTFSVSLGHACDKLDALIMA